MDNNNKFIQGEKIYLREVRETDVTDNYYNWLNDPEVNKFLETRYIPRSKVNIIEYVKSMDGNANEIFFAICDKTNDKHIGNIKVGPINWVHRYADISLLIGDKSYWGKGIATQSIRLLTEFCFFVLNLHKLKAGCYENNVGSQSAFEKVGFKVEGIIKNQWINGNKYQNEILLGLCFEDFNP